MSTHEHQFRDPFLFGFEDVLVTEKIRCDNEYCEILKPTQYEVQFDSFVVDGVPLTTEEAKDRWDDICNSYGPEIDVIGERWQSDGVEFQTKSGQASFYYDDNFEILQSVQLVLGGSKIKFDVEKYRELDPRER